MKSFKNYTQTTAYEKLRDTFTSEKLPHLKEIYPRSKKNFIETDRFIFDFSKTHLSLADWDVYTEMLNELDFAWQREALFQGKKLNITENRPALHTLFRDPTDAPLEINGIDLKEIVRKENGKIRDFVDKFRTGKLKGATGKILDTVVNIGIGGSHLGPQTVVRALKKNNKTRHFFLHNVDDKHVEHVLQLADPERTLFVVVSKSFSTSETLTNAQLIKEILTEKWGEKAVEKHMIAATSNTEKAQEFGIGGENVFYIPVWIGGRFSLWSPAGISIPLILGYDIYEQLRYGAYLADIHFRTQSVEKNLPVIMALLTLIYNNLRGYTSEVHIPYREALSDFPFYLQQLSMESNGKAVQRNGAPGRYNTCPAVWGYTGTNAQHSFFQWLHQAPANAWIYLYGSLDEVKENLRENRQILMSNLLAQSDALAFGRNAENPFENFEGNRPSVSWVFKELNGENLGFLLAVFEHKIFTESVLWNLNAFDQPGVELGKKLAAFYLKKLKNKEKHDNPVYGFVRRNL